MIPETTPDLSGLLPVAGKVLRASDAIAWAIQVWEKLTNQKPREFRKAGPEQ